MEMSLIPLVVFLELYNSIIVQGLTIVFLFFLFCLDQTLPRRLLRMRLAVVHHRRSYPRGTDMLDSTLLK